ncbi:hypothetical protein CRG98_015659 [Punica granatum]|uniref:Uncharacterized protein n=1 Tax=Punica granatum TaxID=22663 RepID=A0A2I0K785_PUNGR|nr:hypothetical protein CRG98_015659 [Punica granatum]
MFKTCCRDPCQDPRAEVDQDRHPDRRDHRQIGAHFATLTCLIGEKKDWGREEEMREVTENEGHREIEEGLGFPLRALPEPDVPSQRLELGFFCARG